MPEVPGQDDEVKKAVPAEGAQAEVVDDELAEKTAALLDGKNLTQTVRPLVGPGVVDMSGVILSRADLDDAIEEVNRAGAEGVKAALDEVDL